MLMPNAQAASVRIRPSPAECYADTESLMPDAEQEQDDDQRERRAEKPKKNQDHLVTSLDHIRVVRSLATARVSRIRSRS